MEKRIEFEVEKIEKDIGQIKKLTLNDCKCTKITGLSPDWKSLEILSIDNAGLKTLEGFPALPSLRKLYLNDNDLSSGLGALTVLPKLTHLELMTNKFEDLESLSPLAKLKTLTHLTLFECPVGKEENKEKIFEMIPSLQYIDSMNKEGKDDADPYDDDEELEDEGLDEEELTDEDLEDEEDVPLEALYNKSYSKDSEEEDDDFEGGEDEEDLDIDEEEAENEGADASKNGEAENDKRGMKRKHD